MAEEELLMAGGRVTINPSTHSSPSSVPNSGIQSDDSAFYAFGDDWDLPPPMSTTFASFLHNKAGVPMEFVREFEQAALVWDMTSFMRWFSMGTTIDVAQRFGVDFCLKYPIQIAKVGVLYEFLKQHPLESSDTGTDDKYNFASFKREEWWPFMQRYRRQIKGNWDFAFTRVIQEATEHYNPDNQAVFEKDALSPTLEYAPPTFGSPKSSFAVHVPPNISQKVTVPTMDQMERNDQVQNVKFSSSNPNGTAAFMDRIERRELANGNMKYDEASKVKRNYISSDIKPWNGRWESFPALKNQIVAATLKVGMSHCTDEEVMKIYVATKGDASIILEFPEYRTTISVRQFESDIRSFYGTLMEIFLRHGDDIILRHKPSRDGILTFNDLVTKFEMGGNKTIVLEKWQNFVTTTTYYEGYPNGMSGLASDFASHFTKIGEFDKELKTIYTESRKMSLLLRALRNEAPDWLVEHLKLHYTSDFEGARNKLTEFEQMQEDTTAQEVIRSKKKGRLLHMTTMMDALLEREMEEHNEKVDNLSIIANRVGREFNRDKYWIAPEIFRAIRSDSKEDILRVKRELLANRVGELEKEVGRKKPQETTEKLPPQYGRVQKVKAYSEDSDKIDLDPDEDDDTDPSDDDDLSALARAMNSRDNNTRYTFMAKTRVFEDEPTVRAHTEYYGAALCNQVSKTGNTIIIADSGADTTILDDTWLILTPLKACRLANLVGYDPGLGTKKGLPIVDAVAKVTTHSGKHVLVGIHEGVYNAGSPHTLISEFQVRNSGIILDSVARNHRLTPDGLYGSQSLYLDPDSIEERIEFKLLNGLMTFEASRPSMEELRSQQIFWITANNKWQPGVFNDDGTIIPPLYASNLRKCDQTSDRCDNDVNKVTGIACIPAVVYIDKNDDSFEEPQQGDDTVWNTHMMTGTDKLVKTDLFYFDPVDATKTPIGKAFHLTLDTTTWSSDDANNNGNFEEKMDGYDVDLFLSNLDGDELSGRNLPLDILGYVCTAKANAIRAKHKELSDSDLQWMSKWLLRPLDVMRQTIGCTTRRLKAYFTYPMKKHYQSRFPWISDSVLRLNEIVSTDTMFSSVKGLQGEKCAQVFFGLTSHVINIYPMKSKKEFLKVYKEFIRDHGAPSILRRDNAMEQKSKEVLDFNRDLFIQNQFSEPGFQHQNNVEPQAIRYIKQATCVILDRSGAPEEAWFFAAQHMAKIHNMTSDLTQRDFITPYQARFARVPDISDLLAFRFWEPVYYLDTEESFPHSKEKKGYWAGTATNVGDALTYWIVPENANMDLCQPIPRSVVRSAIDPIRDNRRVPFREEDLDDEIETKMNELFGTNQAPVTNEPPRQRRTVPIHNRKHKRNAREKYLSVSPDRERGEIQRGEYCQTEAGPMDGPGLGPDPGPCAVLGTTDTTQEDYGPVIGTLRGRGDGTYKDLGTGVVTEEGLNHEIVTDLETELGPEIGSPKGGDVGHRSKLMTGKTLEQDLDPNIISLEQCDERSKGLRRSARLKHNNHNWRSVFAATLEMATTSTMFLPTVEQTKLEFKQSTNLIKPLEQEFSFIGLTKTELEKMAKLQLIDAMTEDNDTSAWDIMEITSHRLANNPRTNGTKVVQGRHLRLKAKFSDGTESWVQAEAVRSDSPFPIVQYVARNRLMDHKWFAWTREYIKDGQKLDNMRQTFLAVVNKAPKFKFGVEVPRSPRHALYLDKINGSNLWEESMKTEFDSLNQHQTFRVLQDGDYLPGDYKRIPYHIVFDVKFDLRRKSRLVAGGNWCDPPKEDVYSGVVALDTIRLGFLLGATNNLSVCAADVGTAFLYGKTTEKVYVIAGPEFGPDIAGKRMVIDKGLYGLRSSSARFHEHLSTKLRMLGFLPSKADSDFWYRDSGDHYEYLATYVDDILVFSRKPMEIIVELKRHYVLKGVGAPEYYLGGDVEEVDDRYWNEKGVCVALSARTYIESSTKKLEDLVGKQFPKQITPMLDGYHPELDESPLLDAVNATKYRAILGSAGWCVTLGRFDVAYATNTLARFSMAPREGHFKQAQRIFGYLSNPAFIKGRLLVDPTYHTIANGLVKNNKKYDWTEFYPDAKEEMPPAGTVPVAKGPKARITVYVDADHAHDQVTRRSVTGILLFVNNTLVRAYTKRQRTVETSTYGSELVASRIATELVMEYRFALRSLGVEVDGPAVMLGDNNAVVLNTTLPSSQLKKKHQAISYHRVREAIAGGILEFHHIPSWANYSDVMTKPVSAQVFHSLVKPLLFRTRWKEEKGVYYANDCKDPKTRLSSTAEKMID